MILSQLLVSDYFNYQYDKSAYKNIQRKTISYMYIYHILEKFIRTLTLPALCHPSDPTVAVKN